MSSILGRICFLADLPLYNTEKPFLALLAPDVNARLDPAIPRHNLEWEEHILSVRDIRDRTGYQLETSGFEACRHQSQIRNIIHGSKVTHADVEAYQRETATFLKAHLDALWITCYGFRVCLTHVRRRESD
jgi:thiamine pyrophosphate-dependent acetolactate synthase large subunit-like protein